MTNHSTQPHSIIPPVDRELIKKELTQELFVRTTNKAGNEIYAFRAEQAPHTMREVGRLREESFRAGGGGTGMDCDIDDFDTMPDGYTQLIVWSPELETIMGGYRYILGEEVLKHPERTNALATSHMFSFSQEFIRDYLPYTIELGRSFVSNEFQSTRAGGLSIYTLDNLWDGLGALTVIYPQIKYFFGKVTMYQNFDKYCRNLILKFMDLYFHDDKRLVYPISPLPIDIPAEEVDRIFVQNDLRTDYKALKMEVRKHNFNIPPLFSAYLSLTPKIKIFGTAINDEFGDVEETGLLTPIADIVSEKKERHIDSYHTSQIPFSASL